MADNGWINTSIGDVCLGVFDGPHATPKKTFEGPVFLGISSLVNGRLDLTDTAHVSEQDFKKWTRRVTPQEDDIVFSYETRLGEASRIPRGLRCCLGRRMALLRPDRKQIDPRFLLYVWLSPRFQNVIRSRTVHGSTVDRIPLLELPKFPIRIPSLHEQRAIAHILGTIDDKIELNRRINETLEAMARAIFKSWFVDFDPVRAKMDGRNPTGMDEATAALFPDRIVHASDGKLIPKGWNILALRDIADLLSGGTPRKDGVALWGGDLPWITPKAMTKIHVHDSENRVTAQAVGNGTRLVEKGSVLIMVRGMGLHQSVRIAQARRSVTFNQDVKALVPTSAGVDGTFLLFAMLESSQFLFSKVLASGHGTGVLHTDIIQSLDFVIPPSDVLTRLTNPLNHYNLRIDANTRETTTLAAIRDALLPKLLSGEIRVGPAEKLVEEAV